MNSDALKPLKAFVVAFTHLVDCESDERLILERGTILLRELISDDGWLPAALAEPHPDHYLQNLLHCDVHERFSVVASVWGPGQGTPPHSHGIWGLVGVLRGAEVVRSVTRESDGGLTLGSVRTLRPGDIDVISQAAGNTHLVSNAHDDRTSISIHVYGNNIGLARRAILRSDGPDEPFLSGYSNATLPNFWLAR